MFGGAVGAAFLAAFAVVLLSGEGKASKRGYDPDAGGAGSSESHREQLERFYLEHNPSKLGRAHDGHLDNLLEKYEGEEHEIFNALKLKYDQCPFFGPDSSCRDRASNCATMARRGECHEQAQKQHAWMVENCAKSCGTCNLQNPRKRCSLKRSPLKWSRKNAIQEGTGYDELFNRILSDFPQFEPRALARPTIRPDGGRDGSWLVQLDNFMTDEEVDALLSNAEGGKLYASDAAAGEGYRTSLTAWCEDDCEANPVVFGVLQKMVDVTGVPLKNFEMLQLLKYAKGQQYQRHHDMIPPEYKLPCGPRILTFFLYLNDVDEGGETTFFDVDGAGGPISVKPRTGSAIIWPIADNDDFHAHDRATFHAAQPLRGNVKYAANGWIHLRDYRYPEYWGCVGETMV